MSLDCDSYLLSPPMLDKCHTMNRTKKRTLYAGLLDQHAVKIWLITSRNGPLVLAHSGRPHISFEEYERLLLSWIKMAGCRIGMTVVVK